MDHKCPLDLELPGWQGYPTKERKMAIINGTSGDDIRVGTAAADTINGLAGSDILIGLAGNDILNGDAESGPFGNDWLYGGSGNDTLNGGGGDDILNGGSGDDTLEGGIGIDTASYRTATAGVSVSLAFNDGQSTGGSGVDTLLSIENVIGSNFSDRIDGIFIIDSILNGGAGNDTLVVDHADGSTLNGGAGNDTLSAAQTGPVTLNGGNGNDLLIASDGSFTLNGGAGNDAIQVSGGGNGQTNATVNGGGGADTLTTLGGINDTFNIIFDYSSVNESPAGLGKDAITGFTGEAVAVGDQIDLRDIDANTLVSGNQAFSYIGGAGFTAAGQLRYAGGILQGSTDGDTAAEFEIELVGAPALVVGGAGTDILL
jgi:Ca2+-binding RTX toxin-like protein